MVDLEDLSVSSFLELDFCDLEVWGFGTPRGRSTTVLALAFAALFGEGVALVNSFVSMCLRPEQQPMLRHAMPSYPHRGTLVS